MVSNLKKSSDPKKEGGEGKRFAMPSGPLDIKMVLAAIGMSGITVGSVLLGFQLAPPKILKDIPMVQHSIEPPGPSFTIASDQIVNLDGGGYLRFSAVFEFHEDKNFFAETAGHGTGAPKSPIAPYEAAYRDALISAVSSKRSGWLMGMHNGVLGKDKLKAELVRSLNARIHGPRVRQVYFTQFTIQP